MRDRRPDAGPVLKHEEDQELVARGRPRGSGDAPWLIRRSASRRSSSTCRPWPARSRAAARGGDAGDARAVGRRRPTLAIVRPQSRRRLYWTMRSVLGHRPGRGADLRPAFREVFGDGRPDQASSRRQHGRPPRRSSGAGVVGQRRHGAAQEQGIWGRPHRRTATTTGRRSTSRWRWQAAKSDSPSSFDSLDPHELAQLYDLMSRLRLATPSAARDGSSGSPRAADRSPADAAHDLRTAESRSSWRAGDGARCPGGWSCLRHLRLDGAVRAGLPAVPHLRGCRRADTEAFVFARS